MNTTASLTLGGEVIINAPGRTCHGKIGTVVSLHLATDEATVQVAGGTRHIIAWDMATLPGGHGTRRRYGAGCHCIDCIEAAATYMREYRARQKEAS